MVAYVASNTKSSVGWYMDSGAPRHMTYDKTLFSKIQEKEGGLSVDLGDDATYPMKRLVSISIRMPSCDVLELNDVFFILGLKKNILSVSCLVDH
jgi:hypothetical protein